MKVDMSPEAVTGRMMLLDQLWELAVSLKNSTLGAKIESSPDRMPIARVKNSTPTRQGIPDLKIAGGNRRTLSVLFISIFFLASHGYSQMRVIGPVAAKPLIAPLPAFPSDAKHWIYGDEVRVDLKVDKEGRVQKATAQGPRFPCSNLEDPTAEAIAEAAVLAARSTIFEPIVWNEHIIEVDRLIISYRLRPPGMLSAEREQRVIGFGDGTSANSKALSLPQPEYPKYTGSEDPRGGLLLGILVDESGQVLSAGMISGLSEFAYAGRKAACSARFPANLIQGHDGKTGGLLLFRSP